MPVLGLFTEIQADPWLCLWNGHAHLLTLPTPPPSALPHKYFPLKKMFGWIWDKQQTWHLLYSEWKIFGKGTNIQTAADAFLSKGYEDLYV